jgi:hypothetical protein
MSEPEMTGERLYGRSDDDANRPGVATLALKPKYTDL